MALPLISRKLATPPATTAPAPATTPLEPVDPPTVAVAARPAPSGAGGTLSTWLARNSSDETKSAEANAGPAPAPAPAEDDDE